MQIFLYADNEGSFQTNLSVYWAHIPEDTFSLVAAF